MPSPDGSPSLSNTTTEFVNNGIGPEPASRRPRGPSVRRACTNCHTGKTRCSESLPCQSCVKRGLVDTCAYAEDVPPDPSNGIHTGAVPAFTTAPMASYPPPMPPHPYYEYNVNTFQVEPPAPPQQQPVPPPQASMPPPPPPSVPHATAQSTPASSRANRPTKRPRELTDEETASITRHFTRGDFFVGSSAPVRIDPRLTVRMVLGEGDQVHFTVGETLSRFPTIQ